MSELKLLEESGISLEFFKDEPRVEHSQKVMPVQWLDDQKHN
jgi:hypothetical protein